MVTSRFRAKKLNRIASGIAILLHEFKTKKMERVGGIT